LTQKELLKEKMYLTTSEALRFCRLMGRSISSTALYYNGMKLGFMTKDQDGFHWIFKRVELSKFLMQKVVDPPPGWVSVQSLALTYRVNLSVMYGRVKRWHLERILCGPLKKMYVNEAEYLKASKTHGRVLLR